MFILPMPMASAVPATIGTITDPGPTLGDDVEVMEERSRPGRGRKDHPGAAQLIEADSADLIRERGPVERDRGPIAQTSFTAGPTRTVAGTAIEPTISAVLDLSLSGIDDRQALPDPPATLNTTSPEVSIVAASAGDAAFPALTDEAAIRTASDDVPSDDDDIRPMALPPSSDGGEDAGLITMLSGGSGGSGGSPPGQDADPVFWLSGGGVATQNGSYYGVIGGSVTAMVTAPSGRSFDTVTWTIGGGILSQTYTWAEGTTQAIADPVKKTDPRPNQEDFAFFWDHTTGNHTVSVDVTYVGGGKGSDSVTVDVRKPTVNTFELDHKSLDVCIFTHEDSSQHLGIHLGAGTSDPGMKFSATVSTTTLPGGGTFNFIQLINSYRQVTVEGDPDSPYTQQTGGLVLDPASNLNVYLADPSDVFLDSYDGVSIPKDSICAPVPPQGYRRGEAPFGIIPDSPYLGWKPPQIAWNTIRMIDTFETYVVYRPDGGIWVTLKRIDFVIAGYASPDGQGGYTLSPIPPFQDPVPSVAGTKQGVDDVKFLSWTDSFFPDRPWQGLEPTDLGTWWRNKDGQPQLPPVQGP